MEQDHDQSQMNTYTNALHLLVLGNAEIVRSYFLDKCVAVIDHEGGVALPRDDVAEPLLLGIFQQLMELDWEGLALYVLAQVVVRCN